MPRRCMLAPMVQAIVAAFENGYLELALERALDAWRQQPSEELAQAIEGLQALAEARFDAPQVRTKETPVRAVWHVGRS